MPRTVQDIIDHADELANLIENYEPRPEDERDPAAFRALNQAALQRSAAEKAVHEAVLEARLQRYSWTLIGSVLGTSGEAARQRYGIATA